LLATFQRDEHAERLRKRRENVLSPEEIEEGVYKNMQVGIDQVKAVKRTFSRLGFGMGHLPNELFLSVYTYWYNSAKRRQQEVMDWSNIVTNSREQPSYMYFMPCKLRDRVTNLLLEMVSSWVNSEISEANMEGEAHGPMQSLTLEMTSLYGIREYAHGARLVQHVDRVKTHACSVIVQVGQVGMLEPWPLEIYDHAGRMHEVSMAPGDILYYESARNIHSRVRPMMGSQFANIFAHYRPLRPDATTGKLEAGDEEWYMRDNVPGTAKAITREEVIAAAAAEDAAVSNDFDTASVKAAGNMDRANDYATMFLSEEETGFLESHQTMYDFWSKHNCPESCAKFMPHYSTLE